MPQAGVVLLDGRDVGTYNNKWLRRQVALVSQEPVLYARSIRWGGGASRVGAVCTLIQVGGCGGGWMDLGPVLYARSFRWGRGEGGNASIIGMAWSHETGTRQLNMHVKVCYVQPARGTRGNMLCA